MTRKPSTQRHRSPNFGAHTTLSFKVSADLNAELVLFANGLGISKSEFIRRAVNEAIERERLNESG